MYHPIESFGESLPKTLCSHHTWMGDGITVSFFFSYITDIGKSRVEDLIQSKSNANDPKDPPFLPKPSSAANLVRNFCIFNYAVVCRAKSQVAKDVDLVAG